MAKPKLRPLLLVAALAAIALTATGCAVVRNLEDGYQRGDVVRGLAETAAGVVEARNQYCDKYEDMAVRHLALAVLRAKFPLIPDNGFCEQIPDDAERVIDLLAGHAPAQGP